MYKQSQFPRRAGMGHEMEKQSQFAHPVGFEASARKSVDPPPKVLNPSLPGLKCTNKANFPRRTVVDDTARKSAHGVEVSNPSPPGMKWKNKANSPRVALDAPVRQMRGHRRKCRVRPHPVLKWINKA